MQSNSPPIAVPLPFANSGTKNTIPTDSQIGILAGAASLTDGFPPLTFTPIAAGGVPPFGADFNGILNMITQSIRWVQGGGRFAFNSDFATTADGYPKGAVLLRSDLSGFWLNTVDGNTVDPEGAGTGWLPYGGGQPLTMAMTGSSVTLTLLQAASPIIQITGTLSANVNLVLPAWSGAKWTLINNASGAFMITAKTAAGAGVVLTAGATDVYSDGTDILTATPGGRLIAVTRITSSGTFTPHPSATITRVRGCGGGGAGGGAVATGSSTVSIGSGGGAGAYGEVMIVGKISSPQSITIGAAGSPVTGGIGGNGGATTFGSYLTLPGGIGGLASTATPPPFYGAPNSGSAAPTVTGATALLALSGPPGGAAYCFGLGASQVVGGQGSSNALGSPGAVAIGFGTGGKGAAVNSSSAAAAGSIGTNGIILIEEYA